MEGFSGLAKVFALAIAALFFTAILFFSTSPSLSQSPAIPISQVSFGSRWETSCSSGTCTTTLYSYTKYYLEQGLWTKINESIGTENCLPAYQYCVNKNLYQAHFSQTSIKIVRGSSEFSFEPVSFSQIPSIEIHGNTITYQNIFPNTDLKYTYTPEKLKESLIIHSLPQTLNLKFKLPQNINLHANHELVQLQSFTPSNPFITSGRIDISSNNQFPFFLERPFASDANGSFQWLNYSLYTNNSETFLEIPVPPNWLSNAAFPVTIDPTITLNDSNVSWDGTVSFDNNVDFNPYSRVNLPPTLEVGHELGSGGIPDKKFRTAIEFDTSGILDNAKIQTLNLSIYITSAGNGGNSNISIFQMEKNNSAYGTGQNSCEGNCLFFTDMGNGTSYFNFTGAAGFNYLDLKASINDLESSLPTQAWFGYGFSSAQGEGNNTPQLATFLFVGKSYDIENQRPYLNITYFIPANESEGRTAIEIGIKNSLGQRQPIETDQQIYLLNENNQQFLGKFDKSTQSGNQTWAFNYNTTGETFTNIPSLFKTLNIWENQTLPNETIISQVSTFINSTRV